ncbi:hypothetical protein [Coraliomargarita parva]|uniref:hypothetical protein n=1 Tax=Coraliomargarita parva TaxID=3014050 RepID=UPI0022B3677A|nr:hypothetical protein [Coraliomargarita parva]
MNYQINILKEHGIVIERIHGEVTIEGVMQKTRQIMENPDYAPHYCGVVDLRGATSKMNKADLNGFVEMINGSTLFGQSLWVMIADDPIVVAMGQIFQHRLNNVDSLRVVSSRQAAIDFIQKPVIADYLPDD